jgi:hypothetical protein
MIVEFPARACLSRKAPIVMSWGRARRPPGPCAAPTRRQVRPPVVERLDDLKSYGDDRRRRLLRHPGQTGVAPNAIELHPVIGFRAN